MTIESFDDLYMEQISDLYSAETQLLEALPNMADAAHDEDLRKAFRHHLEETKKQKQRLEKIFESHGMEFNGHTCDGMKGLIKEGSKMLEKDARPGIRDAGIIAAAQRVEHYEIAGYGTARTFAERLGYDDDAELLQETLDEESAADGKLTDIAEATVNPRAERV